MATIRDNQFGDATGKCSFCPCDSSAFWIAREVTIEVCSSCAVSKLSSLQADSTSCTTLLCLSSVLAQITIAFWRGVVARWEREGRKGGDDAEA